IAQIEMSVRAKTEPRRHYVLGVLRRLPRQTPPNHQHRTAPTLKFGNCSANSRKEFNDIVDKHEAFARNPAFAQVLPLSSTQNWPPRPRFLPPSCAGSIPRQVHDRLRRADLYRSR